MANKIIIDIDELAINIADDLQIDDTALANLRRAVSEVPQGWSDAIMDRLEHDYDLETLLVKSLIQEPKA